MMERREIVAPRGVVLPRYRKKYKTKVRMTLMIIDVMMGK
jgi:hypothetical protein